MNYDQNDCQQFFFITLLFPILANTLKTNVGDVVGCIFDVECSVGGFLILKQIICTVASKKFWSSMSFHNLVRLSQIKKFSLPDHAHVNKVSKK
jgi:hypothetical protein